MESDTKKTLMEILQDGFEIHYAPVSGGILLMKSGKREDANYPITITEFLDLRASDIIEMCPDLERNGGHPIMHGRVIVYKARQSGK